MIGGERHLGRRSDAKKERPPPQNCGKSAAWHALGYPADVIDPAGGGFAGFVTGSLLFLREVRLAFLE